MNKILPQNVRDIIRDIIRDRHRLLPQKLVLLLYMDKLESVYWSIREIGHFARLVILDGISYLRFDAVSYLYTL
jgi:hypothetical protein